MTETPDAVPAPEMHGHRPVTLEPLALLQPAPVQPMTGVGTGTDGQQFVIDRYETPVGSFAFLLDPQVAIAHGEDLIRRGKAASTGLTLPPNMRL